MKMARLYLNKNLDGVKNGTGRRPAAGKSNAPDSFWTSQSWYTFDHILNPARPFLEWLKIGFIVLMIY